MPDDRARLLIQDAAGSIREVVISRTPFTLGRQPENDVVLLDNRISRRHAQIVQGRNEYVLEDASSRHGVYVNGERIESRQLQDGDRINLGVSDAYQITFLSSGSGLQNLLEKINKTPASSTPLLQHLNQLLQLAQVLHRTAALEEVLGTLVDAALRISGAERGILFLTDESGRLQNRLVREPNPSAGLEGYSDELVQRVMRTRRQEVMLQDAARESSAYETIAVSRGQRGALAIPLQKLSVTDGAEGETIRQAAPELIGVLYLESRTKPAAITSVDRRALETLAVEGAMVIENARLLGAAREQERSRHEMALARSIQQSLLPRKLPRIDHCSVHAITRPCRSVGGDYYDVIELPGGRFGLTVADVSGKGLPAAMMSTTLQGAFSVLAAADTEITDLFSRINAFLFDRTPAEMYATVFYGILDPDGGFRFISAGHVPPLHIEAGGAVHTLDSPGFPLGMFPSAAYAATELRLSPGDGVLVFSDGLTEAQNISGDLLGEAGVMEIVQRSAGAGGAQEDICAALASAATAFAGGAPPYDDLTVAALRYAPLGQRSDKP